MLAKVSRRKENRWEWIERTYDCHFTLSTGCCLSHSLAASPVGLHFSFPVCSMASPTLPGFCPFWFPPLPVLPTSGNIPETIQEWSGSAPQNPKHEEWNSGLECTWKYAWKGPVIPQFPQLKYWSGSGHRFLIFWTSFLVTPSFPSSCSSFTYVNPPAKFERHEPIKHIWVISPTCAAARLWGSHGRGSWQSTGCSVWGIQWVMLSIGVPTASPGPGSSTLKAAPDLPSAAL